MVTQKELREAKELDAAALVAESEPAAVAAVAARKKARTALDALKARVVAGEEIQAGKLTMNVQVSYSVAWDEVVRAVLAVPAIAKVVSTCKAVEKILSAANAKDTKVGFVKPSRKASIVEAAGGARAARA